MTESAAEFTGGGCPDDRARTGCQRERFQQPAMIMPNGSEDDDRIGRFPFEGIPDLATQFGPCEGAVGQ